MLVFITLSFGYRQNQPHALKNYWLLLEMDISKQNKLKQFNLCSHYICVASLQKGPHVAKIKK